MAEMATFLGGEHAGEAGRWRGLHAKASASFEAQVRHSLPTKKDIFS